MPHLVVYYTANLDAEPQSRLSELCRALADCMVALRHDDVSPVFPTGGVRVLAYPAPHFAVSDGTRPNDAFVYMNLRMAQGRSAQTHAQVGHALRAIVQTHFAALFATRTLGVTLQIDEGQEVFDAKQNNIHPLYVQAQTNAQLNP